MKSSIKHIELNIDMDHPRLLRNARLAKKEFGSEYRIFRRYESACADIVEHIKDLEFNFKEIGDVGLTWLWSYEQEDNGHRQRKLLDFWREMIDILCRLLVK